MPGRAPVSLHTRRCEDAAHCLVAFGHNKRAWEATRDCLPNDPFVGSTLHHPVLTAVLEALLEATDFRGRVVRDVIDAMRESTREGKRVCRTTSKGSVLVELEPEGEETTCFDILRLALGLVNDRRRAASVLSAAFGDANWRSLVPQWVVTTMDVFFITGRVRDPADWHDEDISEAARDELAMGICGNGFATKNHVADCVCRGCVVCAQTRHVLDCIAEADREGAPGGY